MLDSFIKQLFGATEHKGGLQVDNTFNTNLRKIRKAKGITQEQLADAVGVSPQAVSKWEMSSYPDTQLLPAIADHLGVTIDELWGRGKEEIDIYNRVLEYLKSLPPEAKIHEGFEICRAIPQACCGADEYADLPEGILKGAGWDNHSEVVRKEGFAQSRNTGDLQYFLIMPQPCLGYDCVLAYDEEMIKLFEVLSIPNALGTLYFLAGRSATMFFKSETLMHELGITEENAEQIIEGLLSCQLIWETTLNNGAGKEKIYQYNGHCNLVSFLNFTRTLLHRPQNFSFQSNSRNEPYFANDTYKKKRLTDIADKQEEDQGEADKQQSDKKRNKKGRV
ncbi:MAG: helix-turn-helix transcriptional regulator [Lachnospiraceae bacterium]|nr:helix-turn-helix transcriptional regulator [Lachnospiraceae bacterium]